VGVTPPAPRWAGLAEPLANLADRCDATDTECFADDGTFLCSGLPFDPVAGSQLVFQSAFVADRDER
jgi:hypothetical protein